MKKKLVAMLLVTGMIVSCLSGCGQKEQSEQKGNESKSTADVTASGSEEKLSKAENEEPKVIEKVKMIIRCDPQEDDEMVLAEVNKLLGERYGLELDLLSISPGEYNDRMNLIITSGEDYDICYTTSSYNKFAPNVERGAYLELNDLLETEAAELLMSVYPEGLTSAGTMNGKIYALPSYQKLFSGQAVYIQKDLAEKYNLDVDSVKTIYDLEPFMEQIRDNEKGIWVLDESNKTIPTFNAEDFMSVTAGVETDDYTYTAKKIWECEGWIEKYKTLNSYFHRGFYRSDVATVLDNSADKKANRYAIMCGVYKPGGDVELSAKYGKEYIMIPVTKIYLKSTAGIAAMNAININSKNPEAAIKLLGVLWTDAEIYNMLLYGLEGEHYNKVSENRVSLIDNSGYNRSAHGATFANQFNAWLLDGQPDDVWEVTEALNQSAEKSNIAGFSCSTANVSTELSQISAVNKEYFSRFLYAEDFDAWLTEYTTKLEEAGVEACVAELQKQLDAWRQANGK